MIEQKNKRGTVKKFQSHVTSVTEEGWGER